MNGGPTVAAAIAAVMTLIATTLARVFGGPGWLYLLTLAAMALLITSGFGNVNRKLRNTAAVLLLAGAAVFPFAKDPVAALQRGVFIAGMLVSLTSSVLLIARCAVQSRRIQMIGAALRERQGKARLTAFAAASQFFSGILGLAGANLMFVMAAPPDEESSGMRTASVVSIMRGFAAASCWSPVFGNMAILLALYPSLHWIEVFPAGLAVGQLTLIVGLLMTPLPPQEGSANGADERPTTTSGKELFFLAVPVMGVLLGFLGVVLLVSRTLHVIISAAIIIMGPCVSMAFHALSGSPGSRLRAGMRGTADSMRLYPALASEAMLFLSAGVAGSLMADSFPASWTGAIAALLGGHPFWGLAFLVFAIMLAALAGIHPMLSAVFLASTLTPDVLGLPPIAHMAAILAGWGLSASVTPFSVVSLTASRYARVGLYDISLRKNSGYALCSALLLCAVLAAWIGLTA
ncbi:hypothetical protein [Noviherbaspirillum galbum]|uniref:Uncharacterized protein n=1 Tax=Noviherbaspirillum galbum TaxID=2709383 RepID=A0A6B3SU18_9BURK|nr:hypothetical protein [Noviherbaspirillum galbum]NEX63958.1 hypothetical protein [Noviherbaspirillum galbum]